MKVFILAFLLNVTSFFVNAQDSLNVGLPKEVDSVLRINRIDSLHRTIYWYKHDPNYHPMVNLEDKTLFKVNAFDKIVRDHFPVDEIYKTNFISSNEKGDTLKKNVGRYSFESGELRKDKENWEVYYLVFLFSFFALIRNRFFANLYEIIDANWNNRYINHFLRDENFFRLRSSIFFISYFIFGFSFFIYLVNKRFAVIDLGSNTPFLHIIFYVSAFYFIRFHLVRLLNFTFDLGKLFNGYNTIFYISNIFFTLLILPIMIFIPFVPSGYSDTLLIICLILWGIITGYKYIRTAIYLLFQFQFPVFYLFVYLCTLEIAPMLVLIKLITEQNDKIG